MIELNILWLLKCQCNLIKPNSICTFSLKQTNNYVYGKLWVNLCDLVLIFLVDYLVPIFLVMGDGHRYWV